MTYTQTHIKLTIMKKTLSLLSAVMLLGMVACKKEQTPDDKLDKVAAIAANTPSATYDYATDSSTQVQIVVVRDRSVGTATEIAVTVPDDYVLIGGGAFLISTDGVPRGFLTASYPDDSLTTWNAKFYVRPPFNNALSGFAVGLKLTGLTKAQLKANLQLFSGFDSASVASNYVLIGGGTKVTYSGNGQSLVKSKPDGNTWYSGTKVYTAGDSAVMTSYAIGIRDSIPSFGALKVERVVSVTSVRNNKYDELAIIKLDDKWVTACPGGELVAPNTGRRMIGIYPLTRSATISSSKDSVFATGGNTTGYLLKIRKAN